ncbi:PilZ domain-containing protein [Pleionea sediminis]|uniref:PilZ domain-containing protein n=1 Tax=Pleionea sediminis TaxID=2569479 RepID=UPI0011854DE4|nr:PilZ domain-containing protein [Pleionea sediminis]
MKSLEREYEEKRDFIRMFVDAKVEITDPESGEQFTGDSEDLSAGGVAFMCDHSFDEGRKLVVKVSSVQSKLPPLTANMEVIRSIKGEDGRYKIAGTITNVN